MIKAQFPEEQNADGAFKRQEDAFRNWVKKGENEPFPAEKNRYHIYVSLACPWAHRIIITRALKNLEDIIGITILNPIRNDDDGWEFFNKKTNPDEFEKYGGDPLNNFLLLKENYLASDPNYKGRVTVPVLWDKKRQQIVSNSDDDMLRMLNSEFDDLIENPQNAPNLYPDELRNKIDELNNEIYHKINNGVYKAGFSTSQKVYERAVTQLFKTLDKLEKLLAKNTSNENFLFGKEITETDIRLFVTLIRFDAVYHGHFKCNLKRLIDFPNLRKYTKKIYEIPKVADTVNLAHIKSHYYYTHDNINPTRIIPLGPEKTFPAD